MAEAEAPESVAAEVKAEEAETEEPTATDPPPEEPKAAASEPKPTTDETPVASDPPTAPAAESAAAGAAPASAESPVDLKGKWHLARNERFDDFLKASGVGYVKRKLINTLHPTIEIAQEGQKFTFNSKTPMGNRVTSFTVGEEYPETNPLWGDREHRVMPEWQGAKLVQRVVHGPDDDIARSFEREIVDGELVITMRRGDEYCKRIFKRV